MYNRVRMGGIKHSVTDEQIREVADSAHGFVGADVALLVREASFKAYRRCIREKLTDMSQVWVMLLLLPLQLRTTSWAA